MSIIRAVIHSCKLCQNELRGKCLGDKHYGRKITDENKTMICEEYKYYGTKSAYLKEIQEADR